MRFFRHLTPSRSPGLSATQRVSPSPGGASIVQVVSLPGWRTRPKGGGCELGCVDIGTLGAAPGASNGSTEAESTTSGEGRGEGATAAVEVEVGAALVFLVTLGSSRGASLAAHILAGGLRH